MNKNSRILITGHNGFVGWNDVSPPLLVGVTGIAIEKFTELEFRLFAESLI